MGKTKNITLSVHRAVLDDSLPWTLSSLLTHLKSEMKNGEHLITRGLFEKTAINFPSFPKTNSAVAATFALYEEGAEKSTIKPVGKASTYLTAPLPAPKELEYLDKEIAILVDGNFVIACGLGKRENLLKQAIEQLADRCGVKIHSTALSFMTIPNHLTVQKIRDVGVKSVRFDAANYLGSLDIPKDTLIGQIFGGVATAEALQKDEMIAELSLRQKPFGRGSLDVVPKSKNEFL